MKMLYNCSIEMQTSTGAFNAYTRSNHSKDELQMATPILSRTSGIYIIQNLKNGKIYLGQTIDIRQRWHKHRSALRLNKHCNTHLQAAWNKYGEKAFKFIVLEYISEEMLDKRETYFITLYRERGICYNMQDGGGSTRGRIITNETREKMSKAALKRLPLSEEGRKRISEANTGKISPKRGISPSDETRARLSEAARNRQPPSEETRERISKAHRGKTLSQETRQRISESTQGRIAHNRGKPASDEQKRKQSEVMRGRPSPKRGKPMSEETKRKMSESAKRRYANKCEVEE